MEWAMPDGSTFHTQEVIDDHGDFSYTSVTAIIDGKPFAGHLATPAQNLELDDLLSALSEVSDENIYPLCPESFRKVPDDKNQVHYLKSPSFEWIDAQPGRHFVADRFLSEATLYELLAEQPHPNIAIYHGCVVDEGRIKKLCLSRYERNMLEAIQERRVSDSVAERWILQIVSAVRHLHNLGYAHNDINEMNVCVDSSGNAILIDFDSAELLGDPVLKGQLQEEARQLLSDERNDWVAIGELDRKLREDYTSWRYNDNKDVEVKM
ncbi:hypothetical protein AMS68_001981 [Peltaster fructicola]|uniref:Protein kinase domain-containing protein n=1 Tax=Peltaster fructicola TaxID=286661 RepID=A0A6H0XP13_9PEZI|nr:hypothetical protein AMS68_001981 [Peltaster fructicola]